MFEVLMVFGLGQNKENVGELIIRIFGSIEYYSLKSLPLSPA
jgi:hypothetical protein